MTSRSAWFDGSGVYVFSEDGLVKRDFSGASLWSDEGLDDIRLLHIPHFGVGLTIHPGGDFTVFDVSDGSRLGSGSGAPRGPDLVDNIGVFEHGLVMIEDKSARLVDFDGEVLAEIDHGSTAGEAHWRQQQFLVVSDESGDGWKLYDNRLEPMAHVEITEGEHFDFDGTTVYMVERLEP